MAFWKKKEKKNDKEINLSPTQEELLRLASEIDKLKLGMIKLIESDVEYRKTIKEALVGLLEENVFLKKELLELANSVKNIWGIK